MTIELDHFFILTEPKAPAAGLLRDLGFVEGSSNTHAGQGTSNRRFFLPDTALELAYIRDPDEATRGPGSRLRLVERSLRSNASPFGLVVRTTSRQPEDPFPGWRYFPQYFGPEHSFHVGENSDCLEEPLCICMPFDLLHAKPKNEPRNSRWRMTGLRIDTPVVELSPVLRAFSALDRVVIQMGKAHCMALRFNDGVEGKLADLRPALPLVLAW